MARCFSTKASVGTVLTTHPCVSRCLRVKQQTISSANVDQVHHVVPQGHNNSMYERQIAWDLEHHNKHRRILHSFLLVEFQVIGQLLSTWQPSPVNSSALLPHFSELGQHWFMQWLVAFSAPSHHLSHWHIVNWTVGNKSKWYTNRIYMIFIQENAFEIVLYENGGNFVQGEIS